MAQHRKDHDTPPAAPAPAGPAPAARAEQDSADHPHAHRARPASAVPAAAAAPIAAAAPASSTPAEDERVEYRPSRTQHVCHAGPVALSNWVGRVGNKFVRVYRGAQASTMPEPVIAAMAESGVQIGIITFEELGLRQPPAATTLLR